MLFDGYYEAASELFENSKSFDDIKSGGNDHELGMLEGYTSEMIGKALDYCKEARDVLFELLKKLDIDADDKVLYYATQAKFHLLEGEISKDK